MIIPQPLQRFAWALALPAALGFSTVHGATLRVACSGLGQELELCKTAVDTWARRTGNTVEVVSTSNDGSERLQAFQQALNAGSDKIDVLQLDVAQVGLLGPHLLDLKPYSKGAEKRHFSGMISNSLQNGRLVAMPWFIDAGLLYYRRDLLEKYKQEVPQTWDQLRSVSEVIQSAERRANPKLWGYVWQGRAYEGLTCNAIEWVSSFGGGTIVDEKGRVSIGNPAAVKALETAAGWVGTISPPAVLTFGEEESRKVFQEGNAVFMRNWPYAWALAQAVDSPVKDKVGIAVLPRGTGSTGSNAAALGGQELAVSKYTKHPALAAELVLYLTGDGVQKERAIKASYNPTINDLYRDPEVKRANPFLGSLLRAFSSAVARPSSVTASKYNQVSKEFWSAASDVLSRRSPAEESVKKLEGKLTDIYGGKW
jgi:trehalose/maltose transport system substrate-binding protein